MDKITEKFVKLGIANAPGQETAQKVEKLDLRGERIPGRKVDFSHGDVDAFTPIPDSVETFCEGYKVKGTHQAYTEYRGDAGIRTDVAAKLEKFSGAEVTPDMVILTPGTQGALFLAMGSLVAAGDKVAIVEPDYFANRKLVEFFDGQLMPVQMHYEDESRLGSGIDLDGLEKAFQGGARLFLFSNPNNPTGAIYSPDEIRAVGELAAKYGAYVLADELYSRQIFDNNVYTHLRGMKIMDPEKLITIIGPSKTESMSGFRLGVAYGSRHIIGRMEKLQAIVSLRCAGYCQAEFKLWFNEPEGWMKERVAAHQAIRDMILKKLRAVQGVSARTTNGGSYLFAKMPPLAVSIEDFTKAVRLLADVTVTPGTEFGPQFTHHFRINFSQNAQAAGDAIDRVMAVMDRYRQ